MQTFNDNVNTTQAAFNFNKQKANAAMFQAIKEGEERKRREILDAERTQLQTDEGFRDTVYKDTLGNLTVGYGHKLTADESKRYKEGDKFDTKQLESMYQNDYETARKNAISMLPDGADPELVNIYTNMNFQMGKKGVEGFKKMNSAVNKGDYITAAKEMRNSDWYKQTPERADRLIGRMVGLAGKQQTQPQMNPLTPEDIKAGNQSMYEAERKRLNAANTDPLGLPDGNKYDKKQTTDNKTSLAQKAKDFVANSATGRAVAEDRGLATGFVEGLSTAANTAYDNFRDFSVEQVGAALEPIKKTAREAGSFLFGNETEQNKQQAGQEPQQAQTTQPEQQTQQGEAAPTEEKSTVAEGGLSSTMQASDEDLAAVEQMTQVADERSAKWLEQREKDLVDRLSASHSASPRLLRRNLEEANIEMTPSLENKVKEYETFWQQKQDRNPNHVVSDEVEEIKNQTINRLNGGDNQRVVAEYNQAVEGRQNLREGAMSQYTSEKAWMPQYDNWYEDPAVLNSIRIFGLARLSGADALTAYKAATEEYDRVSHMHQRANDGDQMVALGYPEWQVREWVRTGDESVLKKAASGTQYKEEQRRGVWGQTNLQTGQWTPYQQYAQGGSSGSSSGYGGGSGGSGGQTQTQQQWAVRSQGSLVAGQNLMDSLGKIKKASNESVLGDWGGDYFIKNFVKGDDSGFHIMVDTAFKKAHPEYAEYAATVKAVLDPILRIDSGATITKPEQMQEIMRYVPMPTDSPAEVDRKLGLMADRALGYLTNHKNPNISAPIDFALQTAAWDGDYTVRLTDKQPVIGQTIYDEQGQPVVDEFGVPQRNWMTVSDFYLKNAVPQEGAQ